MLRDVLRDPKVRRAYVTTKIWVFVGAAAVTWPLSTVIGDKAWVGLGVFGVLLLALAAAVLGGAGPAAEESESSDDDEADPAGSEETVVLEITDAIDLHSFPPADVPSVVEAYLDEAVDRGFSEVRLIHGRGIGVQRERVRSLLSRHPAVIDFADAPPDRGGWGATVARLREGVAPGE